MMVTLTKLNNKPFILNTDLIETIEQAPDTVITMTAGNRYVVRETPDEIIERIVQLKRKIYLADDGKE